MSRTVRLGLVSAALALLTILIYAPVRQHGFVNFDDAQYVSQNPHVTGGLTADAVRWAFTTGHAGNWHPVTWISHMLDVEWFGLEPGPHHLTNVALHLISSLLLLWLLWRTTGALWQSATVAALFAVHPLHVESAAWIAERKDVLSGVFFMLTLLAYVSFVQDRRLWRYLILLTCFALALMSKPMVVTLPFVLLLLDVWPLQRMRSSDLGGRFLEKLPLFAMAIASSVVTFIVQRDAGAVKALTALPIDRRIENAVLAYGKYVLMTIWPSGLAPLYPYSASISIAAVAAVLAALVLVTAIAIRVKSRAPYVLVGWLMFLGMLVPVIGLVQTGSQPFADRYMYLPSIGLFVIAAWGLPDLLGRVQQRQAVTWIIASIVVLAYAAVARAQVGYWQDNITLWQHTLEVTDDNYRAHSNLGEALVTANRRDEAIAHFRSALQIKPDFAEAANYLGMALADRGDVNGAIVQFRAALRALPTFTTAHNNLGLALAAESRFDEAVAEFSEAARLDPALAAARTNLGIALARAGRFDEAVRAFTEALALQPDSTQARQNLATAQRDRGAMLAESGRLDDALADLRAAAIVLPNDAELHYFMGVTLAKKGSIEEAVREVRTALQFDPAHEDAKRLLAALIKR